MRIRLVDVVNERAARAFVVDQEQTGSGVRTGRRQRSGGRGELDLCCAELESGSEDRPSATDSADTAWGQLRDVGGSPAVGLPAPIWRAAQCRERLWRAHEAPPSQ